MDRKGWEFNGESDCLAYHERLAGNNGQENRGETMWNLVVFLTTFEIVEPSRIVTFVNTHFYVVTNSNKRA